MPVNVLLIFAAWLENTGPYIIVIIGQPNSVCTIIITLHTKENNQTVGSNSVQY